MPDMFHKILAQIRRIPRGKVATYGDVAYAAGYPGAARQVVWALHSSRGLPWQRVVGAEGKILCTGDLGFEQRMRLQQEGVSFVGMRVAMKQHRFDFFGKVKSNQEGPSARKPAKRKSKKKAGKSIARKKRQP
jgi:methylated-DNA-protein-cysteine methyltransferase related protein